MSDVPSPIPLQVKATAVFSVLEPAKGKGGAWPFFGTGAPAAAPAAPAKKAEKKPVCDHVIGPTSSTFYLSTHNYSNF